MEVTPPTQTQPGQQPEKKRPPKVLVPLSDTVIEELMPVVLTTTVDAGSPMASVRIYFIILFFPSQNV